ncbi:MAG: DUF4401 domain-containing protein [Gammaproteobacteria bacterium]|nr:DUF4401 domain-containing protein [Gammaproteobacteria bacterium]MDH4255237.1 DUF4401 domain-containing protein [Gammaproteobacteria bacterium]MDH5310048.1 DUF4401 domain-containing protein [Gammaproteobacteria bacterium]
MKERLPLQALIGALAAEQLIDGAAADRGRELTGQMYAIQPWYVRTMVGFGAWLASLLLVGFIASFGFAVEGSHVVIGLALAAGSVFLRRRYETDFYVQSALAVSLAGQLMFALGVAELLDWDQPEAIVLAMLSLAALMFVAFPDRIHRVLMVLIVSGSFVVLVYLWKFNWLVPVLGPFFAAALVVLQSTQGSWYEADRGGLVRPLQSGLMLSSFGCLLLSAVYILPELHLRFVFYPRPWISTLLLGALLLYVAGDAWRSLLAADSKTGRITVYALLVGIAAAAWAAPGILLALVVALLGARSGNHVLAGAGVVFLAVFLAAFFYGIETTLLVKSMTLVATGIVILVARWLMLRSLFPSSGGLHDA